MTSDWRPFDEEYSGAQVQGVCAMIGSAPTRLLELGCGDGRVLLPLLERGHDVIGVDSDLAALTAAQNNGVSPARLHLLDFCDPDATEVLEENTFDAVLCLGNTLMTIIDSEVLQRVFVLAAAKTHPRGVFMIDDFPFEYWQEIAEGNWQEGISEDESMQIIWQPGEAVFALRAGDSVDPDNWNIGPNDRLHRLWSWSELREIANTAGFTSASHQPPGHLIVFGKGR